MGVKDWFADVFSTTFKDFLDSLGWMGKIAAGGLVTAVCGNFFIDFLSIPEMPVKFIGTLAMGGGMIGGGYLIYRGVEDKWFPRPPSEEECQQAIENSGGFSFYAGAVLRALTGGIVTTSAVDNAIIAKTCRTNKKMVSYFGIPFYFDTDWKSLPPYKFAALVAAGPLLMFEGVIAWSGAPVDSFWWKVVGLLLGSTGFMMTAAGVGVFLEGVDNSLIEKMLPVVGLIPSVFGFGSAVYKFRGGDTGNVTIAYGVLFGLLSAFFIYRLIYNILVYTKRVQEVGAGPNVGSNTVDLPQKPLTAKDLLAIQGYEDKTKEFQVNFVTRNNLAVGSDEYNYKKNDYANRGCLRVQGDQFNACQDKIRKDYDSWFQ